MDVGIRAARDQRAQERIVAAACVMAKRLGLDPALVAAVHQMQGHDATIAALKQREAIADLLDAIVSMTIPAAPEPTEPPAKGKGKKGAGNDSSE